MNNVAIVHAATISRDLKYHLTAQSFIWDWICDDEVRLTAPCPSRVYRSTEYIRLQGRAHSIAVPAVELAVARLASTG